MPAALAVAATLVLGGCQTFASFPASGAGDWSTVRAAREPVAHAVTYAHPVRFAAGDGVLLADQRETLDGFVQRAQPRRTDPVLVQAHGGMVDAARAAAVVDRLAAHGVAASVGGPAANQEPDVVRVVVQTHIVSLPACPDWTAHPSRTFDNEPSGNFGCASARNLGLMVADPGDLIAGQPIGAADGTVQAAAVQRYRAGKTKALLGAGSTADPQAKNTASPATGGN